MSRIGNQELTIPSGVEVSLNGDVITVKGSKGTLTQNINDVLEVSINDNKSNFSSVNIITSVINSINDLFS